MRQRPFLLKGALIFERALQVKKARVLLWYLLLFSTKLQMKYSADRRESAVVLN